MANIFPTNNRSVEFSQAVHEFDFGSGILRFLAVSLLLVAVGLFVWVLFRFINIIDVVNLK